MSAVHTLLGQDRPGPKFQPLPVSILKFRSGCGFFRCVPTRRLKGSRQHSNWRPFTRPTLAQCINLTQKMFPRQPVTHKHLPQAIETSAMCVCVCACAPVCTLPGRAGALLPYLYCQSCSHTGTTGACGISSLRRHSEHTTLPPAAPELLMDTWACCCRALVFQLLCLPLPLFSPSYLAAQCTSSKGFFFFNFYWNPPTAVPKAMGRR